MGYIVFCVLASLVFVETIGFALSPLTPAPDNGEQIVFSPAYHGYAWAPQFLKEEFRRWQAARHEAYAPFRVWGLTPWKGQYVNVEQSPVGPVRRTINVHNESCAVPGGHRIRVWLFGGSTTFGTGVPDFATIASYLSTYLAAASAECFEVTNFGVEGYATNQEVLLLDDRLKRGFRPDVVIFYDGVNESYVGAVSPADASAHANLERIRGRVEGSWRSRFDFLSKLYSFRLVAAILNRARRQVPPSHTSADLVALARATLDNYEANIYQTEALANAYHFRTLYFWQPAFTSGAKPLTPFEQGLLRQRSRGSGQFVQAFQAVYAEAERRAAISRRFVFLGHVFDHNPGPVYLDGWMHLGPAGNDMIARQIANVVPLTTPEKSASR